MKQFSRKSQDCIRYYILDEKGLSLHYHRENGPAIEYISGPRKGRKEYYKDGYLHRLDGPAIDDANDMSQYWINDCQLPVNEYWNVVQKLNDNKSLDYVNGKFVWK